MIERSVTGLEGVALDWAIAESTEMRTIVCQPGQYRYDVKGGIHCSASYGCSFGAPSPFDDVDEFSPSTDWSLGGPLIAEHCTALNKRESGEWWAHSGNHIGEGPTPLIAACRAIVAAKLGDTVSIPAELERTQ